MSGWRKKQIERLRMTKDEALKLALSTLDEVRQETFRLMRDGQKLYAEEKVWSTIISIKEVLAQPQRTWVGLTDEEKHEIRYSHMTSAEFIEFIEAKLKEKNT
jgi:hypothetical protein